VEALTKVKVMGINIGCGRRTAEELEKSRCSMTWKNGLPKESCAELALRGGTWSVLVLAIPFAVFGDCQLSCRSLNRVNHRHRMGQLKSVPTTLWAL